MSYRNRFQDDDDRGVKMLAALMVIVLIIIIAVLGFFGSRWACTSRWSDFEARYKMVAGCQVKIDGKWLPEDRVRAFD